MISLEMVGWKEGLKTVSLIEAVKLYATKSWIRAKSDVERLLNRESVQLYFDSEDAMKQFKCIAEPLGVIFKDDAGP